MHVLCAGIFLLLFASVLSTSGDTLAISDHFDGKLFHNLAKTSHKTVFDVLRWRFSRTPPKEDPISIIVKPNVPEAINKSNDVKITFVGHSTFLLQANSMNVLTDPIWSERCSPVSFIGPKRIIEPGIRFEDLPKIHVVVISHNHYDHMDLPTLVRLWQRDRPLFIVPLKNRPILLEMGIGNILEQDWWAKTSLQNELTVTAVPAQHWSGRWIVDKNESLWAGFVISFGKKNVYFAGDTGFGGHFSTIKERFKDFDIAILPIGAFLPRWFMSDHHLSPEEAIKAAKIIKARHNIPCHFGLFALGDDGFTLAEKELRTLVKTSDTEFNILAVGESHQSATAIVRQ